MGLIFITTSERSVACGSARQKPLPERQYFFMSAGNATLAYGYE